MFLNSAIKTILYIIGAIIIGRVKETLFALVIWCIIRKQSGGRHAKKDFVCFVISGSAIFFPVMVSSALKLNGKLDIENPIIRINTAFKGCSSLEKISVLPRIYHN